MNNKTLGGLAALSEGIKNFSTAYRDERRYANQQKREDDQITRNNSMMKADMAVKGYNMDDSFNVSKSQDLIEKENFERALKERELGTKMDEKAFEKEYKLGLLGQKEAEMAQRKEEAEAKRGLLAQLAAQKNQVASTRADNKPLTDAESNSAKFYDLMMASKGELDELDGAKKVNPNSLTMQGGGLLNAFSSPSEQKYKNAADNWVRANLRKESGAAIGADEMSAEKSRYFPVFGDSPDVIKQKSMLRAQAESGIKRSAGRAYKDTVGAKASAPARFNKPVEELSDEELMREAGLK